MTILSTKRCKTVHERVQNSATQREVHGRNSVSPEKDKPRTSARLSDSKRVSSVKRVSGFEPPTFTLATCKSTDVATSRTPISSDYERGVAKTVATCEHDEVLVQLNQNWHQLPDHIKLAIQALVKAGGV